MKTITTVFKKELLDSLRDRRTIVFMIVIPLLLFPVLFRVMMSVEKSQSDKERAKKLRVALIDRGNAAPFVATMRARSDLKIEPGVEADSVAALIRADSLDGAFVFAPTFDEDVAEMRPARVDFFYKSTDDRAIVQDRLRKPLEEYERTLVSQRFSRLELDSTITARKTWPVWRSAWDARWAECCPTFSSFFASWVPCTPPSTWAQVKKSAGPWRRCSRRR
jgi:sodium transport system permease protein